MISLDHNFERGHRLPPMPDEPAWTPGIEWMIKRQNDEGKVLIRIDGFCPTFPNQRNLVEDEVPRYQDIFERAENNLGQRTIVRLSLDVDTNRALRVKTSHIEEQSVRMPWGINRYSIEVDDECLDLPNDTYYKAFDGQVGTVQIELYRDTIDTVAYFS